MKKFVFSLICALVFFFLGVFTLKDYGISWDETIHLRRGQAYLYYFLTGKTNYDDLPKINLQGTVGDPAKIPVPRRSFYQNDYHNGAFWLKNDSGVGHPPINGILAALSNYVFYQKLGVLSDIHAHHLFNILVSSLLVFVVVFFAARVFGKFAAVISFLALVTYPLFWAESHFNVKDPAETAFFSAAIWTFYESLRGGKARWLLLSFMFFGLALGVKFNALFIPLIILPYLMIRYQSKLSQPRRSISLVLKRYLVALLLGPIIVATIFIGSWPFLWESWPQNLFKVIEYYKQVGIGTRYQPDSFFAFGFNTFPIQWITFTTPSVVLVLFLTGLVAIWRQRNRKDVSFLLLLWFAVPIIRVSVLNTSIYGGIRQILEFLPAMALIGGLGAWQMVVWARILFRRYLESLAPATLVMQLLIALAFIWPIFILYKMHPNQNVYFNFLIGGLKGAAQKNFPSWGNSLGNAYFQGIKWLNANAEPYAKVALLQGTPSNAPVIYFRPDIKFLVNDNVDSQETYFSGIERGGEYLMELTFSDTGKDFFYAWEYVKKFLIPVYQVTVDGVPILTIWKNDMEHTKPEARLQEKEYRGYLNWVQMDNILDVDIVGEVIISRIKLEFHPQGECTPVRSGFVETQLGDNEWERDRDAIPQLQLYRKTNLQEGKITFFLAGQHTTRLHLIFDTRDSCALRNPNVSLTILE